MSSDIQVRAYRLDDAQALANIFYNTIHRVNCQDYSAEQIKAWAPESSRDPNTWRAKWEKLSPLVAEKEGVIVGFAEFEANGHIDCFYVHHEYIGKGVGSALIDEIERIACEKVIDRIYVEVSITAKPFFEAKGYEVVRSQRVTIRGIELKNFKMEKRFYHTNRKIELSDYKVEWPSQANQAMNDIQECLKEHCLELHHFGSTSIPGLCAKDKIDLICIVDKLENSLQLEQIGYEFRGEWNVPLRYGFAKRSPGFKANLHVTEQNHGFVTLNLHFRDYLRTHKDARDAYAQVKREILTDPSMHQKTDKGFGFPNYSLAKDQFIKSVIESSGYKGRHVNFCAHEREWQSYYRIRKEQLLDETQVKHDNNHYHFVLYLGTEIIGCAQVEKLNETEVILRVFAIDFSYQHKDHEQFFQQMIEQWVHHHGYQMIKLDF